MIIIVNSLHLLLTICILLSILLLLLHHHILFNFFKRYLVSILVIEFLRLTILIIQLKILLFSIHLFIILSLITILFTLFLLFFSIHIFHWLSFSWRRNKHSFPWIVELIDCALQTNIINVSYFKFCGNLNFKYFINLHLQLL